MNKIALEQKRMQDKQTSLLYWWNKVKDLGIPVPKTVILLVPSKAMFAFQADGGDIAMIHNKKDDGTISADETKWFRKYNRSASHLNQFYNTIKNEAVKVGFPLFMRSDMFSGKHQWKNTCFVENVSNIIKNLQELQEMQEMVSFPFRMDFEAVVLREFIEFESTFKAFEDFPVARERRYFINNHKICCKHLYWIPASIAQCWKKPADWKEQLKSLNTDRPGDREILEDYTKRVAKEFPGFWSVDFAYSKTENKWYLIDMARGERSFHPKCEIRDKILGKEEGRRLGGPKDPAEDDYDVGGL